MAAMTPNSSSTPDSPFDFATPYDLMVGVWSGVATLFDGQGEFQTLTPSMVAIYWQQRPTLLHYRQIEEDFPQSGKLRVKSIPALPKIDAAQKMNARVILQTTNLHFDLRVNGKYCKASGLNGPGLQSVEGTESSSGVYIFNLGFIGGRYYNNQYFINTNERHIIGPYIADGSPQVAFVVAQAFTRVSYDVPPALRSDLGK
jgi:hypothetical protein